MRRVVHDSCIVNVLSKGSIEESRESFQANEYTEEEMRKNLAPNLAPYVSSSSRYISTGKKVKSYRSYFGNKHSQNHLSVFQFWKVWIPYYPHKFFRESNKYSALKSSKSWAMFYLKYMYHVLSTYFLYLMISNCQLRSLKNQQELGCILA